MRMQAGPGKHPAPFLTQVAGQDKARHFLDASPCHFFAREGLTMKKPVVFMLRRADTGG